MGWSMDWARGDGDNVTDSVGALWLGRAIDRLLLLVTPALIRPAFRPYAASGSDRFVVSTSMLDFGCHGLDACFTPPRRDEDDP